MQLSHGAQPDWADLLAAEWTDRIREIYRNRGNDGSVSAPIVTKVGRELVKPIDRAFGTDLDYDSPDYAMREALKRNTWKFSVAKNYNDCERLSNLLVRKDGSLRPWNEFKKEALFVVGASNRYLKTEYDTVVAGAQMSRLWQDTQRDKHIFPYAQFDVVRDGRTSDICAPLDGIICKVDDPRLAYFWPPNHFNCRTTIRRLRNGVPTANDAWPEMEIPKDWKNNAGVTGEIFTKENPYFLKTSKSVLQIGDDLYRRGVSYEKYKTDLSYTDVKMNDLGGVKAIHTDHKFDKILGHLEKEVRDILFDAGYHITLESEKGFATKHIEGHLNGFKNEIKSLMGNSAATVAKRIQNSVEKNSEVCTLYFPKENAEELFALALELYTGKLPKLIVINGKKIIRADIKPL